MAKTKPDAGAPREVLLEFRDWKTLPGVKDPLRKDISALAACGQSLFMACDETASVERLTRTAEGFYSNHVHYALGELFELPDGPHGEIDIEGLDISEGELWITGSHALKRDKPKRGKNGAVAALDRMMGIDRDPNRYFIGCVPLEADDTGEPTLAPSRDRKPASIKLKKKNSRLLKWLKDDPHLALFFDIPSKENGFDIEGIAARGDRVWLGLRGPVLRGYAVVIELDFKRPRARRLKARRIDGKRRYRKHLIDTDGLGIRDLLFDGNDLLLLTGTPLASDGPSFVLRWRDAAVDTTSGVVDPDRVEPVMELPYRGPIDHPEGICWLRDEPGGGRRLLVLYDSPDPRRLKEDPLLLIGDSFAVANPSDG